MHHNNAYPDLQANFVEPETPVTGGDQGLAQALLIQCTQLVLRLLRLSRPFHPVGSR
jgi:hypothetical protein